MLRLDPNAAAAKAEALLPKIREDPATGVTVDNLKHFAVTNYEQCAKLLDEGLSNRTVGSTAMNASSSRSHCIFTLEIQQKSATSKIQLIDLAGSEKTATVGIASNVSSRLREAILPTRVIAGASHLFAVVHSRLTCRPKLKGRACSKASISINPSPCSDSASLPCARKL